MKNKNILITEPKEIAKEAVEMLEKRGFTTLYSFDEKNAEIVQGLFIRTYTNVTKEYLDQFPNLEFILKAGVGLDSIDLAECKKRNILVVNAPGSNANAVAEYILTAILIFLRKIDVQIKKIRNSNWRDIDNIGEELKNKTIGLVGCGAIGKLLAKKLANFDTSIIGYDPHINEKTLKEFGIKKCELDYLIQNSDIISLQLPLTPETKDMFGKKEFSRMKKNALFINISRGELVIEDELIEVLENDVIAGAVLDVFRNEPNINKKLFETKNLLLTPHIGGFTKEANIQMATLAVKKFLRS